MLTKNLERLGHCKTRRPVINKLRTSVGNSESINSIFEELFGGDVNEATMAANVLIPVLHKVFGEIQLEAECTMSLQFGVNTVTLDTRKSSSLNGRADFFLRDRATRKIVAVIEAKKPSHPLDEDDNEQVKSYMRAQLPLVPYGFIVNANEPTRLFAWKDGDIVKLDEDSKELFSSTPSFIDSKIYQTALRTLMRASPVYRDEVVTQISRRKLKAIGMPSSSPRAVVQGLVDGMKDSQSTITFVTSPPKCGKSQALRDLASALPLLRPIIFVEQSLGQYDALAKAVNDFEIDGDLSDPMFHRFLKARTSTSLPICIMIDASDTSEELIALIIFIAETSNSNAHVVISASFQVTSKLLFREDFSSFTNFYDKITILEMGAFTDKELATALSASSVDLAKSPFGRLLRWPGLRHAASDTKNLGAALCSWFHSSPTPVKLAMSILGADLAHSGEWNTDRLPITFVRERSQELTSLIKYGFVIELPRVKSGLSDYAFACVEIAIYALLSHIFEVAPREDRAASMDALVKRWEKFESEQEMVALAAILPTFLTELTDEPLDRIVRYMLSISFGSYVLETISRSQLFAEFADSFDSQIDSAQSNILQKPSFEILSKALLIFRDRVGLMPDFAELERELGETRRFFDGKRNPILNTKLSVEQWKNPSILRKLGKSALLDSLYRLSIGDVSWLPESLDEEAIRLVAIAIVDVATPYRAGFPIDSQIDYLASIITRRHPKDLPLLLRNRACSSRQASVCEVNVSYLAQLVIDEYVKGTWEPLSDCFAYYQAIFSDLKDFLLKGLLEKGDPTSFSNVFINALQHCFQELDPSYQKQILCRLIAMNKDVGRVICHIARTVFVAICHEHPQEFSQLSKLVLNSEETASILHVITTRKAIDKISREDEFWGLVKTLKVPTLCYVLATKEFFDELFSILTFPISDISVFLDSGEIKSGWELVFGALCFIDLGSRPIVSDTSWFQYSERWCLNTVEWIKNAPNFGLVKGASWNVSRCKKYIQTGTQEFVQRKKLLKIDLTFKAALLNAHRSEFNRIYIREIVALTHKNDAEYRMLIAKRLILSGFDLWEIKTSEYLYPRLKDLLEDVFLVLSLEEKRDWVAWILRHYKRLRQFPNFITYSIRELLSNQTIKEIFLEMLFDGITENVLLILPIVDISLSSFGENAGQLAKILNEAIAETSEGSDGFLSRFPDEFKHIQAFLPRHYEVKQKRLSESKILDAFEHATTLLPKLPIALASWKDRTKIRSMLSPVGEGYLRYTLKEFKNSLTLRSF